ncbi:(d)CMP kinase [Amycolatopsis sp. ATCC 39116]|uniref:(d)CMP kinase n=1 Tax=Amycolatopsis sp. (strain ATCC 39116 / 75iv2) TaxID=385957 RepID=UPI0002625D0F|nr:(d)CMP kinase [Amycolatopsis sp. ATCC 39116]
MTADTPDRHDLLARLRRAKAVLDELQRLHADDVRRRDLFELGTYIHDLASTGASVNPSANLQAILGHLEEIERTSLGTSEAQKLRRETPPEIAADAIRRSQNPPSSVQANERRQQWVARWLPDTDEGTSVADLPGLVQIPGQQIASADDGTAVRFPVLTGREQQVFILAREGLTNREIGERLTLEERTVESYLSGLLRKLAAGPARQSPAQGRTLRGVVAIDGVAIDGPASSEKLSIASRVATKVNAWFLDSHLLYRMATFAVLQAGIDINDEQQIFEIAHRGRLFADAIRAVPPGGFPAHEALLALINSPTVSKAMPTVAAEPEIRQVCVHRLRQLIEERTTAGDGIVVAGRDIGTVVAPESPLKIRLVGNSLPTTRRRDVRDAVDLDIAEHSLDAAVSLVVSLAEQRGLLGDEFAHLAIGQPPNR